MPRQSMPLASLTSPVAVNRCSWSMLQCTKCVDNYFYEVAAGRGACYHCPEHAECSQGTTLPTISIDEGYWRVSSSSKVILPCPGYAKACAGITGTNRTAFNADAQCTPHAMGPLCTLCTRSHFKVNAQALCQDCPTHQSFFLRVPIKTYVAVGLVLTAGVVRGIYMYFHGLTNAAADQAEYKDFMVRLKTKAKILITTVYSLSPSFLPQRDDLKYLTSHFEYLSGPSFPCPF